MSESTKTPDAIEENWQFAKPLADLQENKVVMARVSGKQIAMAAKVLAVTS